MVYHWQAFCVMLYHHTLYPPVGPALLQMQQYASTGITSSWIPENSFMSNISIEKLNKNKSVNTSLLQNILGSIHDLGKLGPYKFYQQQKIA